MRHFKKTKQCEANSNSRAYRMLAALGLTILTAFIGLPAQAQSEDFKAQYWAFPTSPDAYPEMSDTNLKKRKSFGVAFHGGGNRAAPAALGQLRALHDLGWIKKARYITAISGGSWTAIPYTYLPGCDGSAQLERFLGTYYAPNALVPELVYLANAGEDQAHRAFGDGSMLSAVNDSVITRRFLRALGEGFFDEAYSRALELIYFSRFDLGRGPNESKQDERLFTWRKSDMIELVKNNTQSVDKVDDNDFYYVRCDRPYLIVGGTLLTKRLSPRAKHKFRVEMTPLYTGLPQEITHAFGNGAKVKATGGFVESAGYDRITNAVYPSKGKIMLGLRQPKIGSITNPTRLRFSLQNMAAVSGAAPQEAILRPALINLISSNLGLPEHFVPVDVRTPKLHSLESLGQLPFEKEWAHADGGHEDNLGITPLLAREVKNILAFVNTSAPLDPKEMAACKDALKPYEDAVPGFGAPRISRKELGHCEKMIGDDIASFFFRTKNHIHNPQLNRIDQSKGAGTDLKPYYDLLSIAEDFLREDGDISNRNGLSCKRYRVSAVGGVNYSPMICFVWLSQDQRWFNAIKKAAKIQGVDDAAQEALRYQLDLGKDWAPNGRPDRSVLAANGFPYIGTFVDADWHVIKVVRTRALALANYTSWVLKDRSKGVTKAFAKNGLHLMPD